MVKDRRVRLRPKPGAQGLYYGGGYSGISTSSNFRQNMLNSDLGNIPSLPWLSNRSDNYISPTTPNIIQDQNDAAGIAQALGVPASQISVGNIIDPSNFGNALGNFFGSGSFSAGSMGNILEPLSATDGMVFPYTPTVDYSQSIDYTSYDPTHSNQEFFSYVRSRAPVIGVSGKFSIQNLDEARYALAAIHFCRVVSKMAFGQSENAGTPPPVLLFSGYGDYVFNDLNVIMTNFSISYPEDIDYIQIPNTNSYLPAMFNINLGLVVQNTPAKQRSFNLGSFRNGSLLKNKGWS